jgi:hypothetical protein
MKKMIFYFLVLTLSAAVVGCEKTETTVSLETIAYSKEYAAYKKVFLDKSMFLSVVGKLDFDALREASKTLNQKGDPNDYPRDAYDHIENGREYLQHSINVRVSLNLLQEKYGYLDLSDEDFDKVRELYTNASIKGPGFSEEELLKILEKNTTND